MFSHDNANQLSSIEYRDASNALLGDLIYGYDLAGRRTSMGGAFARAGLPAALGSATYDANNRLSDWGGAALSYDANGNLLGFQGKSYGWNSRDQLTSISGAATASFAYDALGRREGRSVSGTSRQFLYDGLNPIQERSGGSVTANILTGPGIDEFFKRTEGSNVEHYLTDALGSTLRLTDGSAAKLVDYTYTPYGATSADASSTSPFQYTGRENDGTGLYYYRARYYDPVLARFIAEDPIGLAGGDNVYAYVGGDPISFTDPHGLFINSVQATCMRDPEFCIQIMGQIAQNTSIIVSGCVGKASQAMNGLNNIVMMAVFAGGIKALGSAASNGGKPLLGRNPTFSGSRTNTGLPGNRATAKSIFRNQTRGQVVAQSPMKNGGVMRTAGDGTIIRMNPDGTTRVDLPGRGPMKNGESIHIPQKE